MQCNSAREPVKNRRDAYGVFVGRSRADIAAVCCALRDAGIESTDSMTWLRKKLGDDVCQSVLASNPGETLRKAAEVALFESARVAWVVTASDPPKALAQAASDLLSASQTGRPAGLFIIESPASGPLMHALVEFARHWPNVSVEVTPLAELPGRVVAWCATGTEVGGAQ